MNQTTNRAKILYNKEAEEALIGCILIHSTATFLDIEEIGIEPGDFFIEKSGWIFEAAKHLHEQGIAVDMVTLPDELTSRGQIISIGGASHLTQLLNQTPTHTHAVDYARKIKDYSNKRQRLEHARRLAAAHDNESTYAEILKQASETVTKPNTKTTWTLKELLAAEFTDPEWVIPGILPLGGLAILAGRPKLGKSWLALQWVLAAGNGGKVFGEPVRKCKVLYLALEDSPRRLKSRIKKQIENDPGVIDLENIHFEFTWPDLKDGGMEKLTDMVARNGYELVVIDTISRAANFRQKEVEDVTGLYDPLQRLAMEFGCTILLIDHHRKPAGDITDLIDDVSGATGKTGVADTIIGLYRKRMETVATLKATGRDQDEKELAVKFDKEFCCWQYLGEADEVARTEGRQEILDALDDFGGETTLTKLSNHLSKSKSYIHKVLCKLETEGVVEQPQSRGPYRRTSCSPGEQGEQGEQGENNNSFDDTQNYSNGHKNGHLQPYFDDFEPPSEDSGYLNYYSHYDD
ncbi:MAG: AAA family ATPase [Anaerolineae bacterium]|nr:AAA family ATPase [Anaerolineae bacterium]